MPLALTSTLLHALYIDGDHVYDTQYHFHEKSGKIKRARVLSGLHQ